MRRISREIEVLDERVAAILRQKTPQERLEISYQLWQMTRDILHANIARQHSDWTTDQIDKEVARRMAGGSTSGSCSIG